ncbi:MAG: hypothetical protein IJ492_04975, partial [Clostridia bacterium]|nr:hypothetical protein [Clostridia bacterium]MBQ8505603.1 hypothetical protein [Clostridia bacterium]
TINKITVNAGNKAGTLTVYVSKDGETWTECDSTSTTSSYTDYTFELDGEYQYVKLESTGAQIRVKYVTVD